VDRTLIQVLADVTDAGFTVRDVVVIDRGGYWANVLIEWGPGRASQRHAAADQAVLAAEIRDELTRRTPRVDARAVVAVEQIGPSAAPIEAHP
jgi:hypothetical protein